MGACADVDGRVVAWGRGDVRVVEEAENGPAGTADVPGGEPGGAAGGRGDLEVLVECKVGCA